MDSELCLNFHRLVCLLIIIKMHQQKYFTMNTYCTFGKPEELNLSCQRLSSLMVHASLNRHSSVYTWSNYLNFTDSKNKEQLRTLWNKGSLWIKHMPSYIPLTDMRSIKLQRRHRSLSLIQILRKRINKHRTLYIQSCITYSFHSY